MPLIFVTKKKKPKSYKDMYHMHIHSNVQNENIKTMFPIMKKCILNQIWGHLVIF
jgi:hypothetical protein